MSDEWAALADQFVDGAYATVKGRVRTYVLHRQLLEHLPVAPGSVLDVGGGAGNQSVPLARLGHSVVLLDSSEAMLAKAAQRLGAEPAEVRDRVRLVLGRGEQASELTDGQLFDLVLCHGVLMYLTDPRPMLDALGACLAHGGLLSVMALNAKTLSVRPALERRWAEALAALDAVEELGVLGVATRADDVEELSGLMLERGVTPVGWYGVWLFADWMDLDGSADDEVAQIAELELAASRRDPYRSMSRVFHLLSRG